MKPIEITLDRPRTLVFDFNAMVAIEEATGEAILAPGFWDRFQEKPKAKILRGLLWACLLKDDPGLTLDQAGQMITFANMGQIIDKIIQAFNVSAGVDVPLPVAQAD